MALDIQAGQTVLITGATGAVGRAAIQIAHWKRARVIGASRSDKPTEADILINTTQADWPSLAKAHTADRGVDVVFDTVGGALFEPSLKTLAAGGRYVVISSAGTRRVEFDLVDFYHSSHHLIGVDTVKLTGEEIARIMDQLRPGFESGALRPALAKTWTLANAIDAYGVVQKGDAIERQVLLPQAT